MATLKEIAYNIKNTVEGGRSTQSSPFSPRQIAFFAIYYRNLLIRRDVNYWKRVDQLEQDLGLLSVEVTEEAVGKANEMPKAIARTSREIPKPVRMRRRAPFTFIGSPDLDESYSFSTIGQARHQSHGRYTDNDSRSFFHDSRIYLTSDKVADLINDLLDGGSLSDLDTSVVEESITTIRVKGIFADPREAWSFREQKPYDWDKELEGMPEDLIQRITQSILNGEASMIMQSTMDTENDNLPINQEPDDNEEARG